MNGQPIISLPVLDLPLLPVLFTELFHPFFRISEEGDAKCLFNFGRYSMVEHDMTLHRYWSSSCKDCELKAQCTTGEQRRITPWEHEEILDAMQTRLDNAPDSMRLRRQTVEHSFGTLKAWMEATHFLIKTLKGLHCNVLEIIPISGQNKI